MRSGRLVSCPGRAKGDSLLSLGMAIRSARVSRNVIFDLFRYPPISISTSAANPNFELKCCDTFLSAFS